MVIVRPRRIFPGASILRVQFASFMVKIQIEEDLFFKNWKSNHKWDIMNYFYWEDTGCRVQGAGYCPPSLKLRMVIGAGFVTHLEPCTMHLAPCTLHQPKREPPSLYVFFQVERSLNWRGIMCSGILGKMGNGELRNRRKVFFTMSFTYWCLFNNSRIFRLLSDSIQVNKTMINITVTLPYSHIPIYAFYRIG